MGQRLPEVGFREIEASALDLDPPQGDQMAAPGQQRRLAQGGPGGLGEGGQQPFGRVVQIAVRMEVVDRLDPGRLGDGVEGLLEQAAVHQQLGEAVVEHVAVGLVPDSQAHHPDRDPARAPDVGPGVVVERTQRERLLDPLGVFAMLIHTAQVGPVPAGGRADGDGAGVGRMGQHELLVGARGPSAVLDDQLPDPQVNLAAKPFEGGGVLGSDGPLEGVDRGEEVALPGQATPLRVGGAADGAGDRSQREQGRQQHGEPQGDPPAHSNSSTVVTGTPRAVSPRVTRNAASTTNSRPLAGI